MRRAATAVGAMPSDDMCVGARRSRVGIDYMSIVERGFCTSGAMDSA